MILTSLAEYSDSVTMVGTRMIRRCDIHSGLMALMSVMAEGLTLAAFMMNRRAILRAELLGVPLNSQVVDFEPTLKL